MEDSRSASSRNPTPPPAARKPNDSSASSFEEDEGRERLKRHRDDVAGKVKIPDKWGQEQMMKDWIEFSTFDALLGSHRMIIAARDALIADARKAKSPRLSIHSSC
ncbi:protein BIC2-like [Prosopis cineraria]|uniref:protein BIC2-like n=1 Tax=Prosopis cineraria TaxID=364024 RepID=UPI0024109020|nr:protein BIC2-like [Prosopis cineraria]